ncbi:hypothetical protein BDP27DRAFT_1422832 [Rhodocollybia butyracea]|uniref:Uncharacterized protein n=1 Tax=Rhodocollybia butyracea TaxID=206335 RepID=A0A9P5U630_9AGAR|nr:hypothetical protein BDP27DRAFT_1422832 [Rhodocollybia butyracea]
MNSRSQTAYRLLNSLRKAANVRELFLTSTHKGYALHDIMTITEFCPQLSHFGCVLSPTVPSEEYLNRFYAAILSNLIYVQFIEISVNHSDKLFLVQRHVDVIAHAVVFNKRFSDTSFEILVKCNLSAKPMVEFTYG